MKCDDCGLKVAGVGTAAVEHCEEIKRLRGVEKREQALIKQLPTVNMHRHLQKLEDSNIRLERRLQEAESKVSQMKPIIDALDTCIEEQECGFDVLASASWDLVKEKFKAYQKE